MKAFLVVQCSCRGEPVRFRGTPFSARLGTFTETQTFWMPNFSSTRQRSAEGTSGASLLLTSRSVSELKDSLTGEHYCYRTACAQGSAQIALHVMRWQKHSKSESRSQNLFDISKYCFAHHTHCSSGCYVAKLDHASRRHGKRLSISSASGSGGRITDA